MASSSNGDQDDIIVAINITPLVDVVLVLLIIFMVTARLMIPPSIPLELPKAQTGEMSKVTPMAITIRKAENRHPARLYFNGKLVTVKQLSLRISELVKKKGTKNLQAIIAADKVVPHGKVIWLLDQLRRHGIEQYAFNIDPNVVQNP